MPNHTAGPWEASGFAVYAGGSDRGVARAATEHLADVSSDPDWNEHSRIGDEEACANARLIAAAPTLLEACEAADVAIRNICILIERGDLHSDLSARDAGLTKLAVTDRRISETMRAAIRRARGEA